MATSRDSNKQSLAIIIKFRDGSTIRVLPDRDSNSYDRHFIKPSMAWKFVLDGLRNVGRSTSIATIHKLLAKDNKGKQTR